jgi:glucose-6-phosphate dehydrogenase assembly protein OpcA
MIVDLDETTTTAVNKKLSELRERAGAVTMGRVLTLLIAPDSEEVLEDSLTAAHGWTRSCARAATVAPARW